MCVCKTENVFISTHLSWKSVERWAQLEPLFRENLNRIRQKSQKPKKCTQYKRTINVLTSSISKPKKVQSVNMMTFHFFFALFISMPSCLFPLIVPFSLLSPLLDPNGINPGRHFVLQFYKLLHIMDNDSNSIGYTPPYSLVWYNFMCPMWQHISIISPSHALSNLQEESEWRDAGIYYCKLLICPSQ